MESGQYQALSASPGSGRGRPTTILETFVSPSLVVWDQRSSALGSSMVVSRGLQSRVLIAITGMEACLPHQERSSV